MPGVRGSLLHLISTGVWVVAIIPTVTIWRESILWIAFMSIWANVVSHATAYEAARAKELQQDKAGASAEGQGQEDSDQEQGEPDRSEHHEGTSWVAP